MEDSNHTDYSCSSNTDVSSSKASPLFCFLLFANFLSWKNRDYLAHNGHGITTCSAHEWAAMLPFHFTITIFTLDEAWMKRAWHESAAVFACHPLAKGLRFEKPFLYFFIFWGENHVYWYIFLVHSHFRKYIICLDCLKWLWLKLLYWR